MVTEQQLWPGPRPMGMCARGLGLALILFTIVGACARLADHQAHGSDEALAQGIGEPDFGEDGFRLVSTRQPGAAPDFRLRNQDDRMVSLSDYRGHFVHIDFAATWCAPCHLQAGYLRRMEHELEPYGFVSLTVMVTRTPADVKSWARKYRLRNVLGDLEGEARTRFEAFSFPTNVILRPDGSVAGRWAGAPRDAASFQRHLHRLIPEMYRDGPIDNNNGESGGAPAAPRAPTIPSAPRSHGAGAGVVYLDL